EKLTNLYLVPTLYHDLLHHERFQTTDVSSVRKLGFAGAPMTDGLLQSLKAAFKPDLFVNHYGSSEIYTFTIDQNAAAKPGSAGRAGINQMVRVARLGATSPDEVAGPGEEGEIIALLAGDESFEGYWRRPDADAKALRHGWYFTGDTGYFDRDGDLFVTGRVDDMIITGGENVSPVEIESCLSLHPAVLEVAVVGLGRTLGKDRLRFRQTQRRCRAAAARSILSGRGPLQFQASAPLYLRRGAPEIARREALAPQAAGGRVRARASDRDVRASRYTSTRNRTMS